jgi:hypothetical protein
MATSRSELCKKCPACSDLHIRPGTTWLDDAIETLVFSTERSVYCHIHDGSIEAQLPNAAT